MRTQRRLGIAIFLLGVTYAYGAFLGGMSWLWDLLWKGYLPAITWWQYLLAPLCIGAVAMSSEWLFEKLQEVTGFGASGHTRIRHNLELLLLFIGLAAFVIGPALYSIAHR